MSGTFHLAALVTGTGDLTLGLVEFRVLDAQGQLIPGGQVVAPVDADGVSLASLAGLARDLTRWKPRLRGSVCRSAPAVTICVNVPPLVTLNGNAPMTVECHAAFVDPGASAQDCRGTALAVTVSGTVNANAPGTYTLTYSATAGGQTSHVSRTVGVVDSTPPTITLNGSDTQVIECHGAYTELGATASDLCAGDLTSAIITVPAPCTWTRWAPTRSLIPFRTVKIPPPHIALFNRRYDTAPLSLLGPNPQTVECHGAYSELGATASDICAGNLTGAIVIDFSAVNPNAVGTSLGHLYGHRRHEPGQRHAHRQRCGHDPPTVTLLGANPQVIECHTSYTELGATASDACAGDLTSALVINASAVNVNSIGTYQVTYMVSDGDRSTTVNRSVHVVDTVSPTLTPCPSPMTVPPDPGANDGPSQLDSANRVG